MCQDPKIDDKSASPEILLTEYKAAQASAEHHDRLVWTVTSIVWAGNLALIGFILKNPMTGWSGIISLFLCAIGILITQFAWNAQGEFRYARNLKYSRCKEIEKILGMNHHLALEWKTKSQTDKYSLIMKLFLVAWVCVVISILWKIFS